jgi:hypothetical protein
MKVPYDIHFLALIQIVYQKDKFHYFSSKSVISIMIVVKGNYVDWAENMFKQLQNELIRWITSHTKMLRCIIRVDL